jgi:hypothetical protein
VHFKQMSISKQMLTCKPIPTYQKIQFFSFTTSFFLPRTFNIRG